MGVSAILAFVSTLIYIAFTVAFAFTHNKTQTSSLQSNALLYYIMGVIFLFAAFIFELCLLIVPDDATWQVRLAALDLTFVVALLVLMIFIVRQDKLLSQWNKTPQIMLYLAWFFMLLNIIANLIIFFSEACV